MPRTAATKKPSRKLRAVKPALLPTQRFNQVALLIVVAVIAIVGVKVAFFSSAAGNFIKLATHPQASLQPTSYGKSLAALESWNGKLYSGFGDWGLGSSVNTGPIAITPFDTSTNTFAANPEVMAAAHSIHQWRKINGNLYGPAAQNAGADYIVGTIGSGGAPVWKNALADGFTHAFDVLSLTGSDLWVIGQTGPNAIARRSLDGGTTWQTVRSVPSSNGSSTARFFGGGLYQGKLYLQATNNDAGGSIAESGSKVFDPATSTWSDGPNLGIFNHAEEFAGKMVYSAAFASGVTAGYFRAFDGSTSTAPGGMYIYNYTIDRTTNTLYVITSSGDVKKSTDLINWVLVGNAPGGRSIALHNNIIYVGGSDSAIYKHDQATGPGGTTGDTIVPTVAISQPMNGSVVSNRATIQASASDNVKVVKMDLYIDGAMVKTSVSGSIKYGWNTRNVVFGQHTILVKAYDAAGNIGQANAVVTK